MLKPVICLLSMLSVLLNDNTVIYVQGLTVMGSYETELAKIEAGRQELANAEKLFDLPITMYPELVNVQREMRGLRQIYEIHKAQKVRCN